MQTWRTEPQTSRGLTIFGTVGCEKVIFLFFMPSIIQLFKANCINFKIRKKIECRRENCFILSAREIVLGNREPQDLITVVSEADPNSFSVTGPFVFSRDQAEV